MSKVKVLFFAADPFSAPPDGRVPRLRLDEDVRLIREKVRAAQHRDALEFDVRWAARTDDLLQALNETRPQVVHFSGHGGSAGLVLVGADGRGPHHVNEAALAHLFRVFRGDIRVAVLNACFSLPRAEAIAGVVGCAIGTRGAISDAAAITFGASFYRALAFGQSVQAAFDQASAALALEHFGDRDCPHLVARPGVDPAELVLVAPATAGAGQRRWVRMGMAGAALAGAAVVASMNLPEGMRGGAGAQAADSLRAGAPVTAGDTAPPADAAPTATVGIPESGSARPARRTTQAVSAPRETEEGGASVQPSPQPADEPVVRELPPADDRFGMPDGEETDRSRRPAFPRGA